MGVVANPPIHYLIRLSPLIEVVMFCSTLYLWAKIQQPPIFETNSRIHFYANGELWSFPSSLWRFLRNRAWTSIEASTGISHGARLDDFAKKTCTQIIQVSTWGFPKMGVPLVIIHFRVGFSNVFCHPAIEVPPWLWKSTSKPMVTWRPKPCVSGAHVE